MADFYAPMPYTPVTMIQLHAFRSRVQGFMVGLGFPRDWYITLLAAFIGSLAGVAGMLSAVVFCPLTAIILVFEITRDYMVILPVMLTAILATLFAQVAMRESLYTMVLRDRGIRVGTHGDLTMLRRIEAGSIPLVEPLYVRPDDPVQMVLDRALNHPHGDFVVCDTLGKYVGLITSEDLYLILRSQDAIPLMIAQELMRSDLPTVRWEETLDLVFDKFSTHEIASLAVVDESNRVVGLITRSRVMKQYHQALSQ